MFLCLLFHKWSKWKPFNMNIIHFDQKNKRHEWKELWQERKCERCGYTERERV
jgi:hypothetical protein